MTLPDGAYEPCSWSEIREHFQKYGSDHVYFHDATRWRPTISGDRDFVEMALEGATVDCTC